MRFKSQNLQCSPWLGAVLIAGVVVAFTFLVVFSGRLQVASDNAAEQGLQSARNDIGRHQFQWW